MVIILGVLFLSTASMPAQVGALSVDELQAQIANLLAQVEKLQEQLPSVQVPMPSKSRPCPQLPRVLSRGYRGDDVSSLQRYLDVQETGYFGAITERAVQTFQTYIGLMSSSSSAASGYGVVGTKTRSAIYAACDSSVPVNDVLSVSARGLSISVDVTVNGKGSCLARQYILDFGDGSALPIIPISANTCSAIKKTMPHTYAKNGAYTVTLSSDGGKISVPLTVEGKALQTAPTTPSCYAPMFLPVSSIPAAFLGVRWTLPIFSVSTTSDAASVTADGLPPGVTLRGQGSSSVGTSTTWILDGAPSVSGTYSLTLSAKNLCGTAVRTISLPVNTVGVSQSQCVSRPAPSCNGTLMWLGNDGNGCSSGYQCIAQRTVSCPVYNTPLCPIGQTVQSGAVDVNGCQTAPRCVASATTTTASGSCTTPWGSLVVASGQTASSQPYFTKGTYSGSVVVPLMRCTNGLWYVCDWQGNICNTLYAPL